MTTKPRQTTATAALTRHQHLISVPASSAYSYRDDVALSKTLVAWLRLVQIIRDVPVVASQECKRGYLELYERDIVKLLDDVPVPNFQSCLFIHSYQHLLAQIEDFCSFLYHSRVTCAYDFSVSIAPAPVKSD